MKGIGIVDFGDQRLNPKIMIKSLFARIYSENRNNIFGKIMELSALVFGNGYVQAIIEISYLIYSSLYFSNNNKITGLFIFISSIYGFFTFIFIYLDNRKTRIINACENLVRVSRELEKLIGDRMRILENKSRLYYPCNDFDTEIDREGFLICEALYRILSIYLDHPELEIVLWYLEGDYEDSGVIIPLAFATQSDNPPSWFTNEFSKKDKSQYRIFECFENNKIIKYLTKHDCQTNLWYPNYLEKQESDTYKNTSQYIAIPIRKRNGIAFAAIQFRAFSEKVFPNDEDKMKEIINECVYPLTTYYELAFEEQDSIDFLLDEIDFLQNDEKIEIKENSEDGQELQSEKGNNVGSN